MNASCFFQNRMNCPVKPDSISGYRGVGYRKHCGLYTERITNDVR